MNFKLFGAYTIRILLPLKFSWAASASPGAGGRRGGGCRRASRPGWGQWRVWGRRSRRRSACRRRWWSRCSTGTPVTQGKHQWTKLHYKIDINLCTFNVACTSYVHKQIPIQLHNLQHKLNLLLTVCIPSSEPPRSLIFSTLYPSTMFIRALHFCKNFKYQRALQGAPSYK